MKGRFFVTTHVLFHIGTTMCLSHGQLICHYAVFVNVFPVVLCI